MTSITWSITEECVFLMQEVLLDKQKIIGKTNRFYLKVNFSTGCLEIIDFQNKQITSIIDLLEIQQVRDTDKCKQSMTYLKCEFDKQFAIFFGRKFLLRSLLFKTDDENVYKKWINELPKAIDLLKNSTYNCMVQKFLNKQFISIDNNLRNCDLTTVIARLTLWFELRNYRFPYFYPLKKLFDAHVNLNSLPITFVKFKEIYYHVVLEKLDNVLSSIFSVYFNKFEQIDDEYRNLTVPIIVPVEFLVINKKNMIKLLQECQYLSYSEAINTADYIMNNCSSYQNCITETEFLFYLLSNENSIFDKNKETVYQDMSKPLSHYWIESSHNTYLYGNQLMSDSSVECYVRALQQGCRCIEIDVWNRDNSVAITHGYTQCTEIDFKDLINAINAYAFEYSKFPLIISIENHCNTVNQQLMASYFQNVFGSKLISNFLNENEKEYPSPNELAGRIILKDKKQNYSNNDNKKVKKKDKNKERDSFNCDDDDGSQKSFKEVEVLDEQYNMYQKYMFKIENNSQLYIWKIVAKNRNEFKIEKIDAYESVYYSKCANDNIYINLCEEDIEPWFIADLTREKSNDILKSYKEAFETGTFLIRKSEGSADYLTLCFLEVKPDSVSCEVFYIRIKVETIKKTKKYNFAKNTFNSLTELVEFYRKNKIKSEEIKRPISLGIGVNEKTISIDEDWFCPNENRLSGNELLLNYKYDGSFFIRSAERTNGLNEDNQKHVYTLTFFYVDNVFYAKIFVQKEDYHIRYFLNNRDFSSLKELVQYYRENTLYKNQKLTLGIKNHKLKDIFEKSKSKEKNNIPINSSYIFSKAGNTLIPQGEDNDIFEEKVLEIRNIDLSVKLNEKLKKYEFTISGKDMNNIEVKMNGRADEDTYKNILSKIESIKRNSKIFTRNESTSDLSEKSIDIYDQNYSNLICYFEVVSFNIDNPIGNYYEISSFSESEKNLIKNNSMLFNKRHSIQFSRIYPKGSRFDSSNYDPIPFWINGCQLVALNYQTPDKPMQINHAMFANNGGCGYVLKPDYLINCISEPGLQNKETKIYKIIVTPILGHFLPKTKEEAKAASPFLEIELISECDLLNTKEKKIRTNTIKGNGLCPIWFDKQFYVVFELTNIECAFLRFTVCETDVLGSPILLAQATYPVSCLREGYRSVSLKNLYGESLELSSLLVHLKIEKKMN